MWHNSGMDKSKKKHTSFALSGEALRLLGEIAKSQGISMTAVLEIIIREKAKEKGAAVNLGRLTNEGVEHAGLPVELGA